MYFNNSRGGRVENMIAGNSIREAVRQAIYNENEEK